MILPLSSQLFQPILHFSIVSPLRQFLLLNLKLIIIIINIIFLYINTCNVYFSLSILNILT